MTPLQRLVRVQDISQRLKEIEAQGMAERAASIGEVRALQAEFNTLLSGAERPPQELVGQIDPATWAKAFCERYHGHAEESMLPWFDAAMASAHALGRDQGIAEGRKVGAQAVEQLIAEVQLILQLDARRQIRLGNVRDMTSPDAPPESMAERLRRALEALGIEPVDSAQPR